MTTQIRVALNDRVAAVLRRNSKLSATTMAMLAFEAVFPEYLSYAEQDSRLLALTQGRVLIQEIPPTKETAV